MLNARGQEELGFDLENAIKCFDAYSRSTGMDCILIDSRGITLHRCSGSNNTFSFCSKAGCVTGSKINCSTVHRYGSYQAERFGGKYVFFCPLGLVHWASPIIADGTLKGAALGGPILMVEPEEFLIGDILKEVLEDDASIQELSELINCVPVVKPDVVDSMSELLFIVCSHISDIHASQYLEERKMHQMQSQISTYIHQIKNASGFEGESSSYPIDKEKELLSLIKVGDKPGSQKILNEILGYVFFATGGNFDLIKARVIELVVLLSRAALEGGADVEQIFGLNCSYLSRINDFTSIEEITYWLSGIMARFTDCVFNLVGVKHLDVIYKAIDFIKRNYNRKITLDDVAANVYLSPSYFSKIFKEEMNCNFNTYLNQVRVETSKQLLADDRVSLVDVSSLVGFEDQSYFTKVFKKLTGVSPGKYRESRGLLKASVPNN